MSDAAPRFAWTLEVARGVAVIWVFLFHVQSMAHAAAPSLHGLSAMGSAGVVLFFVISGFCIHASASRKVRYGSSGAADFMRRRMLRIFPPFWASIIVVLALPHALALLSALASGRYEVPAAADWWQWTVLDWLGLVTLSRGLFTGNADAFSPINAVYWSLAIEVQFYFIVALALCSGRAWNHCLAAVTVLCLLLIGFEVPLPATLFVSYWPQFAVGIGLHMLTQRSVALPGDGGVRTSVIAALCFGALIIAIARTGMPSPLGFAVAAAVAIWLMGHVESGARRRFAAPLHPLVRLPLRLALAAGVCSYSVYLLHGKLYLLPWMFVRQVVPADSVWTLVGVVFMTVALCYGFYVIVERPFASGRKRG